MTNAEDEIIGLFYQIYPLTKDDFSDVLEYAKYYDSEGINQQDCDANDGCDFSIIGYAAEGMICYGRLKYPLGLSDEDQSFYASNFPFRLIGEDRIIGLGCNEDYSDDLIDIINYTLVLAKNITTENKYLDLQQYFEWNPESYPIHFITLGITILTGIAENLLTKDNIDQFIDSSNEAGETEILAFLLDYKNKHFPMDGDSFQLNPVD